MNRMIKYLLLAPKMMKSKNLFNLISLKILHLTSKNKKWKEKEFIII